MKRNVKITTLICILFVAVIACSGITAALLHLDANRINNTFAIGSVGCKVEEDLKTPGVKKDVKLKNTGTDDAFLRACVVVNWVDESGNIYGVAPKAGTDYTVETPSPYGFIKVGNEYYCKNIVKAGETSPVLFTAIAPVDGKAPDGYVLSVEILGSAIQSSPVSAVEDAWGVTVSNNAITE